MRHRNIIYAKNIIRTVLNKRNSVTMDPEYDSSKVEAYAIKDDLSIVFLDRPPVQSLYPNVERIKMNIASKLEYRERLSRNYENENETGSFFIPLDHKKILRRRSADLTDQMGNSRTQSGSTSSSTVMWQRLGEQEYMKLESTEDENLETEKATTSEMEIPIHAENAQKPSKEFQKKLAERMYQYSNVGAVEKSTVIIQKYVRRYLVKKKYVKLKKMKYQRMKTIEEFIYTEKSYLKSMREFNEVYYRKFLELLKKNKSPISATVVNHLFSGIETFCQLSQQLVKQLEKTVFEAFEQGMEYNHWNKFGAVLLTIAPFLKMYMNYCNRQEKNLKLVESLRKKNKKFQSMLIKLDNDPRTSKLGFNSYAHKPIARILKYKLFLRGLIKNTQPTHPDYHNLVESHAMIDEISTYLNESVRELERSDQVLKIQGLFSKRDQKRNVIFDNNRKFLARGVFKTFSSTSSGGKGSSGATGGIFSKVKAGGARAPKDKKTVYVHLFNDLIVFSEKKSSGFKMITRIFLKHADLYFCNELSWKRLIRINHVVLMCSNTIQRDNWLRMIFREMEKYREKRGSFGADEDELEIDELLHDAQGGEGEDELLEMSDEDCVTYIKTNPTKMIKYVSSFDSFAKKVFKNFFQPHERLFVVDKDEMKIFWGSDKKTLEESSLKIEDIREIVVGQTTTSFKRFPKPEFESRSFSLLYGSGKLTRTGEWTGDSLDLIATNKMEFEVWMKGLRFIMQDKRKTLWRRKVDSEFSKDELMINKKKEKKRLLKSFAATGDGYSFGKGEFGVLGHEDAQSKDVKNPKVIFDLLLLDVVALESSKYSSVALTKRGKVVAWGKSSFVGLGDRGIVTRPKPLVFTEKKIVQVAMGGEHVLFLDNKGNVWGAGKSDHGQLGENNAAEEVLARPKLILSTEKYPFVKYIACGLHHSGVVTSGHKVLMFGENIDGQLGLEILKERVYEPTIMCGEREEDEDIIQIALGSWHSLFLRSNGRVMSCGNNEFGALGVPGISDSNKPIDVPNLEKIVSIDSGSSHAAALNMDGELFCWGSGTFGQLGCGKRVKIQHTAIKVCGFRFTQISLGANHSLGIAFEFDSTTTPQKPTSSTSSNTKKKKKKKVVVAFGSGTYGRLGTGSESDCLVPTEVKFFRDKDVRLVSCGISALNSMVVCGHQWVEDEAVSKCMHPGCKSRKFDFINRRHHCRNCGGIFCDRCSQKRIPILEFGFGDEVRVCETCFDVLQV